MTAIPPSDHRAPERLAFSSLSLGSTGSCHTVNSDGFVEVANPVKVVEVATERIQQSVELSPPVSPEVKENLNRNPISPPLSQRVTDRTKRNSTSSIQGKNPPPKKDLLSSLGRVPDSIVANFIHQDPILRALNPEVKPERKDSAPLDTDSTQTQILENLVRENPVLAALNPDLGKPNSRKKSSVDVA